MVTVNGWDPGGVVIAKTNKKNISAHISAHTTIYEKLPGNLKVILLLNKLCILKNVASSPAIICTAQK